MCLHLVCCLFAVSQETGEGFTGPEEGKGGDTAAGDGESEPGKSCSITSCFILMASHLWSGTAGAPAERRETEL